MSINWLPELDNPELYKKKSNFKSSLYSGTESAVKCVTLAITEAGLVYGHHIFGYLWEYIVSNTVTGCSW